VEAPPNLNATAHPMESNEKKWAAGRRVSTRQLIAVRRSSERRTLFL